MNSPKPYVGEMVHVHWRGKCVAAIIGDFWEDLNTARLHMFDAGGLTVDRRSIHGKAGEDQRWHRLHECPHMEEEDEGTQATRRGRVRRVSEGTNGVESEQADDSGAAGQAATNT